MSVRRQTDSNFRTKPLASPGDRLGVGIFFLLYRVEGVLKEKQEFCSGLSLQVGAQVQSELTAWDPRAPHLLP